MDEVGRVLLLKCKVRQNSKELNFIQVPQNLDNVSAFQCKQWVANALDILQKELENMRIEMKCVRNLQKSENEHLEVRLAEGKMFLEAQNAISAVNTQKTAFNAQPLKFDVKVPAVPTAEIAVNCSREEESFGQRIGLIDNLGIPLATKPNLKDFNFSKNMMQTLLADESSAVRFQSHLTNSHPIPTPFDQFPIQVTPGLFGGMLPLTTPAEQLNNNVAVSKSLMAFRNGIVAKNSNATYCIDKTKPTVASVNEKTEGGLKTSTGSMNGSLIMDEFDEEGTVTSLCVESLPDLSSEDTVTIPVIPKLCSAISVPQIGQEAISNAKPQNFVDVYNPIAKFIPPKPETPEFLKKKRYTISEKENLATGTFLKREPIVKPSLQLLHSINVEKVDGNIENQSKNDQQKALATNDLNVTYVVNPNQNSSSSTGFRLLQLSITDYATLEEQIQMKLSLEEINSAIDRLNAMADHKGLKKKLEFTRSDLAKVLPEFDNLQRVYFTSALSTLGRLRRMRGSVFPADDSIFELDLKASLR